MDGPAGFFSDGGIHLSYLMSVFSPGAFHNLWLYVNVLLCTSFELLFLVLFGSHYTLFFGWNYCVGFFYQPLKDIPDWVHFFAFLFCFILFWKSEHVVAKYTNNLKI